MRGEIENRRLDRVVSGRVMNCSFSSEGGSSSYTFHVSILTIVTRDAYDVPP